MKASRLMLLILLALMSSTLCWGQYQDPELSGSSDNEPVLSDRQVSFSSIRGEFQAIFPSGCGKMVTKVPSEEPSSDDDWPAVRVSLTFCDRYGEKGEGCSVSSFFNVRGKENNIAGADEVVERVRRILDTMSVSVVRDAPLRKEFPDGSFIEGMDVFASDSAGAGQAWVRGLLYQGDIYIMAAWSSAGNLWKNPDYVTFFNSFKPGAAD
ncbi:MAG: hypothetical protein GY780_05100 [bacterium]|nr:hypothetical protein [bacterium]